MVGGAAELAAAMLPVVLLTGVFNAILVSALYLPIKPPSSSLTNTQ